VGQTLGRYTILEKVGEGGMGVVYRARDERLERDVALKVLPLGLLADIEARKRFRKEALALSKLNQPNIATIFDFDTHDGVDFLVMEYVEGASLSERVARGPLPEKEVVSIGEQIALALEEASEQGITHRDLKPANIRLTTKGRVKVLDFGLARLLQPATCDSQTQSLTDPRLVSGTLPYMSPEQLRGEVADVRSDIYSTGVVLYELATGRRPFSADVPSRVSDQILHDPPPMPRAVNGRISPELERIALKCLDKQPENRYQSAKELAVDLRRSGSSSSATVQAAAPGKPSHLLPGIAIALAALVVLALGWEAWRGRSHGIRQIQSIAVLPLQNLSQAADQDYFADSMTEALITDLAKIKALRVISRTSTMRFKNTTKTLPEIARELRVDAVVEGSVERAGNRVRITAQLIRASTDQHMWADSYDRDLRDVLMLQSEVAQNIAREVQVSISPDDRARLSNQRQVDPEAYQLYLKGRYFWIKRTPEAVNKAIELFNQAITKDPSYAEAYSGLADAYASLGFSFDVGSMAPNDVQPKAHAAATRAMELNDRLAEAHNSLAYWKLNYGWDWRGAEEEFRRSLELNPGYANAHHWYAHELISAGKSDEALAESKKALELDQLSPIMNVHLGWHYFFARQYDHSLNQLRKTLELDPNYGLAFWYTGWVYEQTGKREEAIAQMLRAKELLKGNLIVEADLAHAYGIAGKKDEARKVLAQLRSLSKQRYVNPYEIALIHLGLSENEQAFQALEEALRDRSDLMIYLKLDPRMDPIRPAPRFAELVRKVSIP
jgi:eukaryotic-like serine/threonine-protein kinase